MSQCGKLGARPILWTKDGTRDKQRLTKQQLSPMTKTTEVKETKER